VKAKIIKFTDPTKEIKKKKEKNKLKGKLTRNKKNCLS